MLLIPIPQIWISAAWISTALSELTFQGPLFAAALGLVVLGISLSIWAVLPRIHLGRKVDSQRVMDQALWEEKEITRAALETTGAMVLLLDRSGRLLRCSPSAEAIIGCTDKEARDQYFWDLFALPEEAPQVKSMFQDLVAKRQVMRRESLFRTSKAGPRWFEWSNSFLLDENGEVKWVVGAGIDVTERKQYERRQEALVVLSAELRGFISRERTLQIIQEQVMRFLQADIAAVAIFHPASDSLLVEKAAGDGAQALMGWRIPADEGVVRFAFESRQAMLRGTASPDLPAVRPSLVSNMRSTVWIPLVMEGEPVGLVLAASQTEIQEGDLHEINTIANIAASAIHRCNLMDETQRRLQRLSALNTINISVSASLDIHVTINLLVNQITNQLGVDAADIFLVDPITRDLSLVAAHGFRSQDISKTRLWLGQGRVGQVALERKSMQLYDPRGIANLFQPVRKIQEDEFVAYEAVPLVLKGEVKGVLETFHRAPYEPDPEWPQFLETLAAETTIAISNAEMMDQLQRSNIDMACAYDATLEGWALALELRDHQTEDHTRRVTDLTVRLAQSLGIRGDDLKYIRYGALLHDIGKIGIPDSILNKPGKLTDEEWVVMRKHPQYSLQMLSSIPFLAQAMVIPYSHHERWDGSGYPQKLAGEQIPLSARLFAVVDVWDAMCFNRVYRDAFPEEEVLDYLQREAGRLFDPNVVTAFVEIRRLMRSGSNM